MEVFGNVDSLKQEISAVMDERLNALKKELEMFRNQINEENAKQLMNIKEQHKTNLVQDIKKEYSQIIGEKTLAAKKAFEEKRESLINNVFAEVLKKAKDITHSTKYIDFVKSQMPSGKNVVVYGDDLFYKKSFPKIKIDNNIIGLKFEDGEVSYDFTVERMIKVRKEELRRLVNTKLFGSD